MTLIFLSPTPEHPNGYLVEAKMEKPSVIGTSMFRYNEVLDDWLAHLLTLPVYASCSVECKGKWKHGEEVVEGKDFKRKLIGASWCASCNDYADVSCVVIHSNSIARDRLVAVPLTPPAEQPEVKGQKEIYKNENKMTKAEILGSKSGDYPDILEGDLLNDPCITPKEAFSAMDEYGSQVAIEIKKWNEGYPSGNEQPVEAEAGLLRAALGDLLEAIPKQTNDHDWWEDELTIAVKNAKAVLELNKQKT